MDKHHEKSVEQTDDASEASSRPAKQKKPKRKKRKLAPFDGHAFDKAIDAIIAKVPKEEWAKVPKDASENLDHYLYGAPKR